MIKAENIIIKDKYEGLKNLALICEAMDEFAKEYHAEQLSIGGVVVSTLCVVCDKKLISKTEDTLIKSDE